MFSEASAASSFGTERQKWSLGLRKALEQQNKLLVEVALEHQIVLFYTTACMPVDIFGL